MAAAYDLFRSKRRVNVLKKVKVNGIWKFCPAVLETNGKLKDKVRVNGRVEVHPEGVYYLEWRHNGQRLREAIRDRAEVLERAYSRALKVDPADRDATRMAIPAPNGSIVPLPAAKPVMIEQMPVHPAPRAAGVQSICQAIESYVQQTVVAALASQLHAAAGIVLEQHEQSQRQLDGHSRQNLQLAAAPRGSESAGPQEADTGKVLLTEAVESYLRDLEPPQREQKTYKKYRATLYLFRDTCSKKYLEDVTREDCLAFIRHLYSIGNAPRTAHNRITIILQLLKLHGITGLLKSRDKPKYVESIREMYQPADLEALFKACDPDEKVSYLFFLLTGERDEEVQHTTWDDIDFGRRCVRVTEKKEFGFKPKDKEEREIPVSSVLLDTLREYRNRQPRTNLHNLVFPTSNGRPDKRFENKLKKLAYRAGLNCGRCVSCYNHKCSSGPHCSKWFLHKFRHTFATMCLENGASVRTLQEWLGHSDLESTMAYLKYVRRKDIHQLVDNSQLASFATASIPGGNERPSVRPVAHHRNA